jgi:glycosyltransferase involved in cell wall biosynthesis
MPETPPELSIVIPAFNEERRLPPTLDKIAAWLEARGTTAEVIVVDDGSRDATSRVAEEQKARLPGLRVLRNERNRGKGYSVRRGMLEARAPLALFTDADLSSPIEEADKLFRALGEQGCQIAMGSRAVDRRNIVVRQSLFRELAGIVFNKLVQAVTGVRLVDTQCGFKAFLTEPARPVFERQRIERFGFDPEVLFIARLRGLKMTEVPVLWAHDPDTRVHMLRDSSRMLFELLSIRWNWLLGRYR